MLKGFKRCLVVLDTTTRTRLVERDTARNGYVYNVIRMDFAERHHFQLSIPNYGSVNSGPILLCKSLLAALKVFLYLSLYKRSSKPVYQKEVEFSRYRKLNVLKYDYLLENLFPAKIKT